MLVKKIGDGVSYFDLLKEIDGKIVSAEKYSKNKKNKYIYLRHDVDSPTMKPAIQLARAEAKRGIVSTYYLRYISEYFKLNKKFLHEVQEISSLGHRIGFHNNIMPIYLNKARPVVEIISKPLNFLRDNGIKVNGCCEHGDPKLLRKKLNNIMIWKNWKQDAFLGPEKRKDIIPNKHKITLEEVGLTYNACYMYRDAFFGDGGGKWTGIWGPFGKQQFYYRKLNQIRKLIIKRFNNLEKGRMIILFHPHWWAHEKI